MLKLTFVALALLLCFTSANEQAEGGVVVSKDKDGVVRAFSGIADPSFANAYAIGASGLRITKDDNSATADAVHFGMVNPSWSTEGTAPLRSKELTYSFSYFTGSISGFASSDLSVGSISGSFFQVIARFFQIFVYLNNDGQPGFQWTLGDDAWTCGQSYDCFVDALKYDLEAATWTKITNNTIDCSDQAGANADCKVYELSTSTTDGVATFTLKLSSQPVTVDGVALTPDYGKLDVIINYPWATKDPNNNYPNAKIGLMSATAGIALDGSLSVGATASGSAAIFGTGSVKGFFSWEGTAAATSGTTTTYFSTITGDAILNFNCGLTCGLVEAVYITITKAAVAIWQGFGWKVQFLFFSWDETRPASVSWDPEIGASVNGSPSPITTSAGSMLSLSPLLMLAVVLFALIRRR